LTISIVFLPVELNEKDHTSTPITKSHDPLFSSNVKSDSMMKKLEEYYLWQSTIVMSGKKIKVYSTPIIVPDISIDRSMVIQSINDHIAFNMPVKVPDGEFNIIKRDDRTVRVYKGPKE